MPNPTHISEGNTISIGPFAFRSNSGFVFHDSPGFETGDEKQLQEVLSFMKKKANSTEVNNQLHAIWSVLLSRRTYYPLMVGERFCFVLDNARPLLPLETAFFETARAGKGFLPPHLSSFKSTHVPVIAIFTKFDDLMTQIYDIDQEDDVNRQNAEEEVEKKFRKPLYGYSFPPRTDVCFEGKC